MTEISASKKIKIEWIDWILFAVAGAAAFLFFCHEDILITANHSYVYLEGHCRSFYTYCHKLNGSYGANYMPTTFLLFAIWNIPLKVLGLGPEYWGDWNQAFVFWNKLLPTLFYLGSMRLISGMTAECFGFTKQKARLAAMIFGMSPLAFYSQFFFCQYDAITVFFMLLGMLFYFRKERSLRNDALFIAAFSVAATLKYHSILIFLVLLFLREKRIQKIFACMAGGSALYGMEFLLYYIFDRKVFLKSVLGFKALNYSSATEIKIGSAAIQIVPFVLCVLLAWVYYTECKNRREEICYAFFFCNGVCFVLFALMHWHPQWILLAVPFWSISICLNQKSQTLLWVEFILGTAFVFYVAAAFANNADQNLLQNGILSFALQFSTDPAVTMQEVLGVSDRSLPFTILAAVFLIYFIFSHPKYCLEELSRFSEKTEALIGARFLWGVLLFAVPAFLCLSAMLEAPEVLWLQPRYSKSETETVSENGNMIQYATIPGDSITKVTIYTIIEEEETAKGENSVEQEGEQEASDALILTITDPQTDQILAECRLDPEDISADGYSSFVVQDCETEPGTQYEFSIYTESGEQGNVSVKYGSHPSKYIGELLDAVQKDYTEDYILLDGEELEGSHLLSEIDGHYRQ